MISKTMEMIDRPYFGYSREVLVESSPLLQNLSSSERVTLIILGKTI